VVGSWPQGDAGRLVASPPVRPAGSTAGTNPWRQVQTVRVTLVSALVTVVALVSLFGQAVRSSRTVDAQLASRSVHDATVDDAFYACIDTQAHSLVGPGQSAALGGDNLADVISMIKGFGAWVTVADPASRADVVLTLHNGKAAPGTCLGTRVVGTYRGPDGRTTVRLGTGAQVAGQGPPSAPPL
jgi:hypothetical protein